MSEPVGTSIALGFTGVVLTVLGVPYLSLLWGFIGAAFIMSFTPPESRSMAIVSVVVGGLVGAALGNGGADIAGRMMPALAGSNAILILASMVGGAGAKPLVSAAIARGQKLIGGEK